MIVTKELRAVARARLLDAQALLRSRRFDGAFYLSGYAVEIALKARICRTLKWPGFPQSGKEFEKFKSLKTHDLEVLLQFSGVEDRVRKRFLPEWSVVLKWDPEKRYQAMGLSQSQQAADMVMCVERLLRIL